MDENNLIQRLRGRASYLRNKGEVKSPGLMEDAAYELERLQRKDAERLQPVVKRFIELSGEYHADCSTLFGRIAELENALEDAKLFANYVECLGRTSCEIYKHELKSSADLSLMRIDAAIGV